MITKILLVMLILIKVNHEHDAKKKSTAHVNCRQINLDNRIMSTDPDICNDASPGIYFEDSLIKQYPKDEFVNVMKSTEWKDDNAGIDPIMLTEWEPGQPSIRLWIVPGCGSVPKLTMMDPRILYRFLQTCSRVPPSHLELGENEEIRLLHVLENMKPEDRVDLLEPGRSLLIAPSIKRLQNIAEMKKQNDLEVSETTARSLTAKYEEEKRQQYEQWLAQQYVDDDDDVNDDDVNDDDDNDDDNDNNNYHNESCSCGVHDNLDRNNNHAADDTDYYRLSTRKPGMHRLMVPSSSSSSSTSSKSQLSLPQQTASTLGPATPSRSAIPSNLPGAAATLPPKIKSTTTVSVHQKRPSSPRTRARFDRWNKPIQNNSGTKASQPISTPTTTSSTTTIKPTTSSQIKRPHHHEASITNQVKRPRITDNDAPRYSEHKRLGMSASIGEHKGENKGEIAEALALETEGDVDNVNRKPHDYHEHRQHQYHNKHDEEQIFLNMAIEASLRDR